MKKLNNQKLIDYYYNKYNLNEIFTNEFKSHMEIFAYNRHEHICNINEEIEYILFFVNGKAKVYNTLANGKSLLLCFYYPLMMIGDMEMLNSSINPINVQALELCHCIGIKMSYAREVLIKDIKFMSHVARSLGDKLDRCSINNSINLLYKLENRLASYIISTSVSEVINNLDICVFDENLTNVAELLGTSYRHLLRTLNMFCTKNILKHHKGFYEVSDMEVLKSFAIDLYK